MVLIDYLLSVAGLGLSSQPSLGRDIIAPQANAIRSPLYSVCLLFVAFSRAKKWIIIRRMMMQKCQKSIVGSHLGEEETWLSVHI